MPNGEFDDDFEETWFTVEPVGDDVVDDLAHDQDLAIFSYLPT